MTTLTVRFDGLNAFTPLKNGTWIAAQPDLGRTFEGFDSSHFPSSHGGPPALAPHVACLVVPDEAVVDLWSSRKPAVRFESAADPNRMFRLYPLKRERLKVAGPGGGEPEENLDLVAPLGKLLPDLSGVAFLDGSLVDPEGFPVQNDGRLNLAGSLRLDGGQLRSGDPVVDPDTGDPRRYVFRPSAHEQGQPDYVYWSREAGQKGAVLCFERKNGGSSELRLRPVDGRYSVDLVNLELETILGIGEPLRPPKTHDIDFAIFYAISAAWPELEVELPVPWIQGGGGYGGSGGEFCKPTRFAGVS